MQFPKTLALAITFIVIASLLAIFAYGVSAQRYRIFPYAYFDDVETAINWFWDRRPGSTPWYYMPTKKTNTVSGERSAPGIAGLNLVTAMGPTASRGRFNLSLRKHMGCQAHRSDWLPAWWA